MYSTKMLTVHGHNRNGSVSVEASRTPFAWPFALNRPIPGLSLSTKHCQYILCHYVEDIEVITYCSTCQGTCCNQGLDQGCQDQGCPDEAYHIHT